jgi:heme-degrading monooxygenase HmoA
MTMFAQLTTMCCLPGQLDEFAGLYEEHVIPITQAQMGYRGLYLLLDRGSGKMVAISLWDSKEDAAAYQRNAGHRDQQSQLSAYLAATPDYEGYEVSVDA